MLKKIAALLLALCMLICLSACNKEKTSSDISSDVSQTQITDSQTEESSEANTTTDTSTQTSDTISTADTKKDTYGLKWNIKEHGVVLAKFLKENGTVKNGKIYCEITANQYSEDYSVLSIINLGSEQVKLIWNISAEVDANNEQIISSIKINERVTIVIEDPTEREEFFKNTLGKLESYIFYEDFADKTNYRGFSLGQNGEEHYSTVESIPNETITTAASPLKTSITGIGMSVKDVGTLEGDFRVSNNACIIRLGIDFSGTYTKQ